MALDARRRRGTKLTDSNPGIFAEDSNRASAWLRVPGVVSERWSSPRAQIGAIIFSVLVITSYFAVSGFPRLGNHSLRPYVERLSKFHTAADYEQLHPLDRNDTAFYNWGFTAIHKVCSSPDVQIQECPHLLAPLKAPHKFLVDGSPIATFFQFTVSPRSTGPTALAELYCELQNQGYPTFTQSWTTIMEWEYSCPLAQATKNLSWKDVEGAVVYIPEGEHTPEEAPTHGVRVLRWFLGFHHDSLAHYLTLGASRIVPLTHEFKNVARGVSSRLLTNLPARIFYREASAKPTWVDQKRNLILIDNDASVDVEKFQKELKKAVPDAEVKRFKGIPRDEVPWWYGRAKAVVDTKIPGYEGILTESILFDTVVIVEKAKVGMNSLDLPIPSWARFERNDFSSLVRAATIALQNYTDVHKDFRHFRQKWVNQQETFRREVSTYFIGRDAIFRTFCRTAYECRSSLAWAISVWNVHPLAIVEIFTPDLKVFDFINDNILLVGKDIIEGAFFSVVEGNEASVLTERSKSPYAARNRLMVWMPPTSLLLSPDTLNEHVRTIESAKSSMICVETVGGMFGVANSKAWFEHATAPNCKVELPAPVPMDVLVLDKSRGEFLFYLTHKTQAYLSELTPTHPYSDAVDILADLVYALRATPLYRQFEYLFLGAHQALIAAFPLPPYLDEYRDVI